MRKAAWRLPFVVALVGALSLGSAAAEHADNDINCERNVTAAGAPGVIHVWLGWQSAPGAVRLCVFTPLTGPDATVRSRLEDGSFCYEIEQSDDPEADVLDDPPECPVQPVRGGVGHGSRIHGHARGREARDRPLSVSLLTPNETNQYAPGAHDGGGAL